MAHAEICPVCGGKGYILVDEPLRPVRGGKGYVVIDKPFKSVKRCHGCGGRGWVEVRDW